MEKITFTIKDRTKLNFIIELLCQFNFVEVQKETRKKPNRDTFFSSAGFMKNRDISAKKLRTDAWKRTS